MLHEASSPLRSWLAGWVQKLALEYSICSVKTRSRLSHGWNWAPREMEDRGEVRAVVFEYQLHREEKKSTSVVQDWGSLRVGI